MFPSRNWSVIDQLYTANPEEAEDSVERNGQAKEVPPHSLHPPGPPLARPILPRERGALDRIVEYLVGDGPQNRYALICQQCFSHNGMALKEEFEYIEPLEDAPPVTETDQGDDKALSTDEDSDQVEGEAEMEQSASQGTAAIAKHESIVPADQREELLADAE
ncbi:UNVERIFIED_CONTAM: hypothetical protein K2H54_043336 [Gekko kuhli]